MFTINFARRDMVFLLAFSISLSLAAVWSFAMLADIQVARWFYVLVAAFVSALVCMPVALGLVLRRKQPV